MSAHSLEAAGATSAEFDALIQELAQFSGHPYAEDMRASLKGNLDGLRELVEYHRAHRPTTQPERAQPAVADATPAKAVKQQPTKNQRFWAPDKAFEMGLDTAELAIYFLLCRRASSSLLAWPSYHDITVRCRINRRKVRPALDCLLALGMIEVARPPTSTKPAWYRLTPHETWVTPGEEEKSA